MNDMTNEPNIEFEIPRRFRCRGLVSLETLTCGYVGKKGKSRHVFSICWKGLKFNWLSINVMADKFWVLEAPRTDD